MTYTMRIPTIGDVLTLAKDWTLTVVAEYRNRTLMVGDSLTSDMAGGVAAGVDTCWFNQHSKPNTTSLPLTHEIENLEQLLDL